MGGKNVLLITSDQQRWDTLGVYNHRIRTPHLDRLAARGITFDRAYTVNPVCTPSRCSMLTGHYPSRHGCYTIGTSLPRDYPTVPGLLSERGWATALLGKGHFSSCLDENSFEAAPHIFNDEVFSRWEGPFYGFEKVRLAIGHTCEKQASGMHYGQWLKERGVHREKFFGRCAYSDFGVWDLPEEYHPSQWTADETIAVIDQYSKEDRPFFIWSSFQDPHNPCVVPEPWASLYNPEDMPLYRGKEGEMEDKPPFYSHLLKEGKLGSPEDFGDKAWHCVGNSSALGMDKKRSREIMACYYGMISLMDHHIGRILRSLEEHGLRDDTIIIFTSDHGDYMGSHGLWWKGLPAYDDALRVPLIVAHPQCKTRGEHSTAFQSTLDIPSVILFEAGQAGKPLVQGVDQSQSWIDASKSCRDWVQTEFRPTESNFMQKVFLTEKWKLVLYNRDYGELYDMEKDPHQYENLWDRNQYKEVKNQLIMKFIQAEMEKDGVLRTRTAPA